MVEDRSKKQRSRIFLICDSSFVRFAQSNDGLLGFDGRVGSERTQFLPVALPALQKNSFSQVTCGDDHVLALTTDGYVYSWGNGQQSQLGRRIIERRKINGLTPEKLAVKHIVLVGSGAYHSFAVDKKGQVFGWGLNSMGQTGAENNDDIIPVPAKVDALDPRKHGGARVVQISAGAHHSLFLLSNGQVYACGRCDGFELGLADDHPAMMEVSEERGRWETRRREALLKETAEWQIRMAEKKARMQAEGANMNAGSMDMVVSEEDMPPKMGPPPDEFVSTPVHVPFPDPPASAPAGAKTKDGKTRIVALASGTRHNLAVAADGTLYSWGFGISSQLGQGDEESVKVPTVVKSKQFLGHKAVGATAGGQHSVVLAIKDPEAAI